MKPWLRFLWNLESAYNLLWKLANFRDADEVFELADLARLILTGSKERK